MKKVFWAVLTAALVLTGAFAAAAAPVTVKIGITGEFYADLWVPAKTALAKEGINLEFVNFSDFVTPNRVLADGEIDLNFFQHNIYLNEEIENHGYKIQNIGNTFVVPLNLFSQKVKSIDEIKDGDVIAIPNDPTNGGRAIKVLASAGLITLKPEAGFNPTKEDIAEYNVKIEINEMAANMILSVLPDVTAGIVNDNFAIDAGLKAEDAVFNDAKTAGRPYWNLIAARTADLDDPAKVEVFSKIVKAFQCEETAKIFKEDFGGYMSPVGWDEDLLAEYRK